MPLINCKIQLELNWNNNCVMYGADTYAGGYNANNKEKTFKRSVYWNEYKSKIETKEADASNLKRFPLDASFQVVNRLFALAF